MPDLDLLRSGEARSSAYRATSVVRGVRHDALTTADFRGCRWIEGEPSLDGFNFQFAVTAAASNSHRPWWPARQLDALERPACC